MRPQEALPHTTHSAIYIRRVRAWLPRDPHEDGEFWFNSEELKLRISNDLNFNMEISTPSGFCFFSLIKDGGEF